MLFRSVPAAQLVPAAEYVTRVLQVADGSKTQVSAVVHERFRSIGLVDALDGIQGTFSHHYPVCIRRVFADDTLISMSSGSENCWYSISFITCVRPREAFYNLARFLAASMAKLFNARLHWGK